MWNMSPSSHKKDDVWSSKRLYEGKLKKNFFVTFKGGVLLHSQQQVRFREYFEYFLMELKYEKNQPFRRRGKNIDFTYKKFQKVINKLVKKNCSTKKLVT